MQKNAREIFRLSTICASNNPKKPAAHGAAGPILMLRLKVDVVEHSTTINIQQNPPVQTLLGRGAGRLNRRKTRWLYLCIVRQAGRPTHHYRSRITHNGPAEGIWWDCHDLSCNDTFFTSFLVSQTPESVQPFLPLTTVTTIGVSVAAALHAVLKHRL